MSHQITITLSDQEYDALLEQADENEQQLETFLHETIVDQLPLSVPETNIQPIVYRCSFCAKSQEQVSNLIVGPAGIYICDECVDLCNEILEALPKSRQASQ